MKLHNIMIKNFKVIVLALLLSAASCGFTTNDLDDPGKDKLLISLISFVLERGHYDPKEFNDDFSEKVYDSYVNSLDPLKRYFLQSDIDEFAKYKDQIDDQIRNEDIAFFDLTYNRLRQRMEESKSFYTDILDKPFDYNKDETINTDYEALGYAKNKKELKERWGQQLKFSAIGTYFDKKDEQRQMEEKRDGVSANAKKKPSEDLLPNKRGEMVFDESKTGGTTSSTDNDTIKNFEPKTDKELEADARELTKTSLKEYYDFADELERKDYFSVYINAIVEEFDPHTYYLAPVDKDRFDMQMSGQFQGIGARLFKKDNSISVSEIISGGPAWRGEELEEGDIILKVKQQDDEAATSIAGMRLDDAVELIKGPKGTKVTLNVKKKTDGSIQNITITRDVVELEETYAKSSTVKKDERTYGVINLPKFYFDMEDFDKRNAASDIKKEIIRLKEQDVQGLVLDLRNNGGGSLSTVVDIAGLFIKDGPVVQVKSNGENSEILKDRDKSILWDGPLVILVNEISASASEILAAAMQDYKRAVIIGSKQTYGKGTVQNVYDLNRWLRQNDMGDMGALKITTQKFYRINGGSTQHKGVVPDIPFPSPIDPAEWGESQEENALPWDSIKRANYTTFGDTQSALDVLAAKHNARIMQDPEFGYIQQDIEKYKENKDKDFISLVESERLAEKKENEEQALARANERLTRMGLPVVEDLEDLPEELEELDPYLTEAANITLDMVNTGKYALTRG